VNFPLLIFTTQLTNLQSRLRRASEDLRFEIKLDHEQVLSSGRIVKCPVFVPGFGSSKGTLIFSSVGEFWDFRNEIIADGFGFSCLSDYDDTYDRESTIEMLSEWGWAGSQENKPDWIVD
jgi:hypothetical protein